MLDSPRPRYLRNLWTALALAAAGCGSDPVAPPQAPVEVVTPLPAATADEDEDPAHPRNRPLPPDPELGKDGLYRLAWTARTERWNHTVTILPSGDVLAIGSDKAFVLARHSGATLESTSMCDALEATAVDARHVLVVCRGEVVELTVPGLVQRGIVKLDGRADKAAVSAGVVAVATGTEGDIQVHDPKTGALLDKLTTPRSPPPGPDETESPPRVTALALSPDGKLLAWSDDKSLIYLRTLAAKAQSLIETGESKPGCLAFSPDAKELFAPDGSWLSRVIDPVQKSRLRQYKADTWTRSAVYVKPGLVAAAGSEGLQLLSANQGDGTRLHYMSQRDEPAEGVGASGDGTMLCTGDRQGIIACFSTKPIPRSTYVAAAPLAPKRP